MAAACSLPEEILLRFPPDDPARLVHAALVCKHWCAIVFDAGFSSRFREFHRTPPLLGFISNMLIQGDWLATQFVPTCSLPASRVHSHWGHQHDVCYADAHHGRVLLYRLCHAGPPPEDLQPDVVFMVWDPTTDEQEEVPMPDVAHGALNWTAAIVCAAAGPCHHLDCRQDPFLIVFMGYDQTHSETHPLLHHGASQSPVISIHSASTMSVHVHGAGCTCAECTLLSGSDVRSYSEV